MKRMNFKCMLLCFFLFAASIPFGGNAAVQAASIPLGWSSLGYNGSGGSSSYDKSTGTLSLSSSGAGIVNQTSVNEQFQYAYTEVTGDFTMIARLKSFPYVSSATAGILVRSAMSQGSSFVYGAYYGTSNKYQPYTISKSAASASAASNSGYKVSGSNVTYDDPPSYMRVRKQWNASGKADVYYDIGTADATTITWTQINAKAMTDVTVSQAVYVGLAVGTSASAAFDSITLMDSYTSDMSTPLGNLQTSLPSPLDPPSVSAAAGNNQIALSWSSVTDATYYQVQRSETSGGPYLQIGPNQVMDTSFTDETAANGSTYYYVVTAANASGVSAYSTEVSSMAGAYLIQDNFENAALGEVPAGYVSIANASDAAINNITVVSNSHLTNTYYTPTETAPAKNISPTIPGNGTNVLWINDNANAGRRGGFTHSFEPVTGLSGLTAELDFMQPALIGDSYPLELLSSTSSTPILTFSITNLKTMATLSAGTWYHLKFVADTGTSSADVFLNGVYEGNYNFTKTDTDIAKIQARTAGSSTGSMYVDNVRVYKQAVTTPQKVKTEGANNKVMLNWNEASGAEAYNVYRSETAGGPYALITTAASPSWTDTGLVNKRTYYYVIAAVKGSEISEYSHEAVGVPNNVTPPATAPEFSQSALQIRDSQLTLGWTSVTGKDEDGTTVPSTYTLLRSTTPNGPFETIAEKLSGTSYLDKGLTNGTEYYYQVTAWNVGGASPDSQLLKISSAAPVAAPLLLSVKKDGAAVALSWTTSSEAVSYTVKRSEMSGGPYTTVAAELTAAAYTDASIVEGQTYYYVVTASRSGQVSRISNELAVDTQQTVDGAPAAPENWQAAASSGQVSLTWSSVPDATAYKVKRSLTAGGPYTVVAASASTSYVDTDVSNGTTYYYVVSAVNAAGEGPGTQEIAALPAKVLTVDKNAAADGVTVFNTIQSAIDAVPLSNTERTIIFITEGTYTEKLSIKSKYISLVGEGMDKTRIVYGDYAGTTATVGQPGHTGNTFLSQTVEVTADYFQASQLTIENSAAPRSAVAQAVALSLKSDMAALESVKLVGYQDTLYTGLNSAGKGRQYFHNSVIQGDVDFIFGEATAAVFDNVKLVLVSNSGGGGHITAGAQKNTSDVGYVFLNSQIVEDPSASGTYDLGRPWKDNAKIKFIHTLIDSDQFLTGGWLSACAGSCITYDFSEYDSYGPGAIPSGRQISTQLTGEEASLTIPQLFADPSNSDPAARTWNPALPVTMPKISYAPSLTVLSASFDKNPLKQSDVYALVSGSGYTLTGITNDGTAWNENDYALSSNVLTLKKEALAKLPEGATTLQVHFDGFSLPLTVVVIQSDASDLGKQVLATNDGWASFSGGTKGGSMAAPSNTYVVTKRSELIQALGGDNSKNASNAAPKLIYVKGTIDMNVDDNDVPVGAEAYQDPAYDFNAYLAAYDPAVWGKAAVPSGSLETARAVSEANQGKQIKINVGSNTTIVGMPGTNAKILGGNLMIQNVDNVIIRNLDFQNAFDYFPQWDPTDGETGNWNSAFDSITLKGATHIWIDHNTFSDGALVDDYSKMYFERQYQQHDGALDITNASDLVTVSYNYFHDHDKTTLVGGSDEFTGDIGKERITFHHNYYKSIVQRAPRVRYGQVHIYNNYYEGTLNHASYPFLYTMGAGFSSQIYAQNNYFKQDAATQASALIGVFAGATNFTDTGSVLNGKEVQIGQSLNIQPVSWTPTLFNRMDAAANVPALVLANAGAEGTLLAEETNSGSTSSSSGGGAAATVQTVQSAADGVQIVNATVTHDTTEDGRAVAQTEIEGSVLKQAAKSLEGSKRTISLEIPGEDQLVRLQLDAAALGEAKLSAPDAVLSVSHDGVVVELPLNKVNTAALTSGTAAGGAPAEVELIFGKVSDTSGNAIAAKAGQSGLTLLSGALEIGMTVQVNGKTTASNIMENGHAYVHIQLAKKLDPKHVTAAFYDPAKGEFGFVPATFTVNAEGTAITAQMKSGGILTLVESHPSFKDMGGHWAEADVSMLTSKLLIQGEAAGQFGPEGHISRAEFAALLVRALNVQMETSESFTDVNGSEWYAGVVAAAAKAGLISGFEDGSFRPNGSLTREQAAVMVIRALQLAGQKPAAQGEGLSRFTTDRSEISPFAQQAVADAVNAGILNGLTDSSFGPQDTTSRAEAAVMLKRLLQAIGFIQS